MFQHNMIVILHDRRAAHCIRLGIYVCKRTRREIYKGNSYLAVGSARGPQAVKFLRSKGHGPGRDHMVHRCKFAVYILYDSYHTNVNI